MAKEVKSEPEGRICKKCGNKLSIYNRMDVCFHHSEHPDHSPSVPYERPLFASHKSLGRQQTIISYSGYFRDE